MKHKKLKFNILIDSYISPEGLFDTFNDYLFHLSDKDFEKVILDLVSERADCFVGYSPADKLIEKLQNIAH